MQHSIRRLALPVLGVILASCRSMSPTHVEPIRSEVSITAHEQLGASARTLQMICKTTQIYPCSNYGIVSSVNRSGASIAINFRGVEVPGICLTSTGPATRTLDLGSLADGSYALTVNSGGSTLNGSLQVTDGVISVTAPPSTAVGFPRPVLHRIPPQTIWGVVGWATPTQAPKAQAYLDALVAAGAGPQSLAPGDYDFFSVTPAGEIQSPETAGYWYAQPYVFKYAGDVATLSSLVHGQSDSLWIRLYTDRGDQFFSWTTLP
jgi:hypothetical protein